MRLNPTEREAIVLNAVWSMIDDMVNFSTFMPLGANTEKITLLPQTSDMLRLFHVLVGDFLSPLVRKGRGGLPFDLPAPPASARPSDLTFLFYLRGVVHDPKLGTNPTLIEAPVEAFASWLEQDSFVEGVWLPEIETEVDLTIKRITWIKICSDIAKHNFARLETNVAKVTRILADHGKEIDAGMGYAALPSFWQWFHTHLFAYHASTIAEFLNEIRWATYNYLRPEFERAYEITRHVHGAAIYKFNPPADISSPISKTMYWDLMNFVRSEPYFPRFTVTPYLKMRY